MQPRNLWLSGCPGHWTAWRPRRLLRQGRGEGRTRRGLRPRHARRGRPRNLGGPSPPRQKTGATEIRW